MAKIIVVVLCVFAVCWQSEAKLFTPCTLVEELRAQGFHEDHLKDWVCLIVNESAMNTSTVGPKTKIGARGYGLFQISDVLWCSHTDTPGKKCHVTCADMMTDNISKAATCAKMIFKHHGFDAWYGWRHHCQGSLPDVNRDCFTGGSRIIPHLLR